MMKKTIWVILPLIAVLIVAWWYVSQPAFDAKAITQMNLYETDTDNHAQVLYKDQADYTLAIDALNRSQVISLDTKPVPSHRLVISYAKEETQTLSLVMDPEAKQVILYDDQGTEGYQLTEEDAIAFMSLEGITSIYPQQDYPVAHLHRHGLDIELLPQEGTWKYKKVNGSYYDSAVRFGDSGEEHQLTLAETDLFTVHFDQPASQVTVHVYQDDEILDTVTLTADVDTITRQTTSNTPWRLTPLLAGNRIERIEFSAYPLEAELEYKIQGLWEEDQAIGNTGELTWQLYGVTDIAPVVSINRSNAMAGDYFSITVDNVGPQDTIDLVQPFSKNVTWWTLDRKKIAFIPLNYWTKKGDYQFDLTIKNTLSPEVHLSLPVTIGKRDFPIQKLYVDATTVSSTQNNEAYEQYAEFMGSIREQSEPQALWSGAFIQPCQGRISTEYGEMRHVNDAPTSYRHSGIDIAAPTGTDIAATNGGRVVRSMNLILTGETVVIDHGLGFFSVYFHMNTRSVEEGQIVEKGQIIGTVGSTGFSTGPHLHWTMSHFETNIDPNTIMEFQPLP